MMDELVWSPQMSLGVPALDDAHKALVEELARLVTASDREFGSCLFALIAGIERDFREEEALMEKIDFPGLKSHREQHARVLSALHHVIPDVMQGDCASAWRAIELLPQWFLFHLSTMDAALAVALDLAGAGWVPSPCRFRASRRQRHLRQIPREKIAAMRFRFTCKERM